MSLSIEILEEILELSPRVRISNVFRTKNDVAQGSVTIHVYEDSGGPGILPECLELEYSPKINLTAIRRSENPS